jgi:hypothetical protein
MTATLVPRVDLNSLKLAGSLGKGGQGQVTAVDGKLINGQWKAVVKIYSPSVARLVNVAALENIVRFPETLGPSDSRWLHENTAWPAVLVEDGQSVCGFLMRVVPPEYYFGFQTQTQGTWQKPANIEFLLNSDRYLSSSGLSITDYERVVLLKSLAISLSRLHSLDVAVGDLSPKNLLFKLSPAPSCFLIDCDAMRVRGASVMQQVQTPDWEVPSGETTATPPADAYKFALLAIRLFARDQSSSNRAALRALSPELDRLAEVSLYHGVSRRPSLADWIPALSAACDALNARTASSAAATSRTSTAAANPLVNRTTSSARPSQVSPPVYASPASRRPRTGAKAVGVLIVAALLAVVAAVSLHAHDARAGQRVAGEATGSAQMSNGQQAAARNLSVLLAQSAADRSSVVNAVSDVSQCGSDLSQDPQIFQSAAASRQKLLSELTNLAGRSALPAQMTQSLASAWQASKDADQDFSAWAQDENSQGCTTDDNSDSNYQAAGGPDQQATNSKMAFVSLWNPVAKKYGLHTYEWNQL